jgi:VWFA-related protein
LKTLAIFLAALMAAPSGLPQSQPTFSTSANVVVVNVTVTGHDGQPIENLKAADFIVLEDGKPQRLQSCELQRLETAALPPVDTAPHRLLENRAAPTPTPEKPAERSEMQDHRLIVMLFDLSSMQPPEQVRALNSATQFLKTKLTPSDLVSIMVFGSSLRTIQDFTGDRDLLIATLQRFHIGESSELASMADTGADSEDQSGLYVADNTEFNIFNTDRKLAALQDAARRLAYYPQKKALVYISSGVEKTGVDNQAQLRATVNAAVRANVAFYTIDARGLSAQVPGGDASQAGAVGSNLYSGAGQTSLRNSFQNQQETLDTLAADTGGKALLDSNDLTVGMTQVQKDIRSYYMLTYGSTNGAEDGRYRRIEVRLAPAYAAMKLKLDYRRGYYGPVAFARMKGEDKETQLSSALESESSVTDLPIAVEIDYFRLAKGKYFVPISVKMPGSALTFRAKGQKQATELDFLAQVRDGRGQPAATVRDTIPLKLDQATAGQVGRSQVEYDTGVTLGPGKYTLKFVARENAEGRLGTFEAPFTVPDLSSGGALRLSSVILSNQTQPAGQVVGVRNGKKLLEQNPLVTPQGQIVPNVTRVFRPGQNLHVYLEVYDPAAPTLPANAPQNMHVASVTADLSFFEGGQKVLETRPVRVNRPDAKREGALSLSLSADTGALKPGEYVCQVNVIDELGRKFAFPRTSLVILPGAETP